MSRRLPAHPNLEHLKKQAKDLLADLRRQNPAAKLADAQQAVAREYGFATWPQLKSHVELLLDPVDRPAARGVTDHANAFVGTWENSRPPGLSVAPVEHRRASGFVQTPQY